MEIKAIIYYVLLRFSIEPNANTQIPIQLKDTLIGLHVEGGANLDFKLRNKWILSGDWDLWCPSTSYRNANDLNKQISKNKIANLIRMFRYCEQLVAIMKNK